MRGGRGPSVDGIQYLRGLAAVLVAFHHARLDFTDGKSWPAFGECGVDIFFVISGFIMACTTPAPGIGSWADRRLAAVDFVLRRLVRIVPLYWLATLWESRRGIAAGHADPDLWKDLLFIPHPSTVWVGQTWPFLPLGWTINYEMFFYAVFAVAILAGRHRLSVACLALVACALLGLVAGPWPDAPVLDYYTRSIVVEFVFGMLICAETSRPNRVRLPRAAAALLGAGALTLLALHMAWPRPLALGVPAAVLVWVSIGLFADTGWRPLRLLGDATYSVYLFHLGAFGVARFIASWIGLHEGGPLANAAIVALHLACACTAGIVIHGLLERPLTTWLQRPAARLVRLTVVRSP